MGAYMKRKGVKNPYFIGMDYQAGWDHIAGARRGYGESAPIAAQVFTPQQQLDFSAELAQLRAAKPDAVFAFYAGGPAVAFVKQYAQSGLSRDIPLYSNVGLSDPLFFSAQGDAALGLVVSGHYSTEVDAGNNKKFVADFRLRYRRDPATYAAQQYDAIMLIDSAVRLVKGDLSNKDALRAAFKKAEFASLRGPFQFNNNHMPIQNVYIQKVEKREDGERYLNRIDTVANIRDPYSADCPMK
jgi:branched-chain amino acid transport system substrate-binding protein